MRQTNDCCGEYVYFDLDVKIQGIYEHAEFIANLVH